MLARKVSVYAIAKRFKLSTHSLYRHAKKHLPPQLRAALLTDSDIEGVDLERLKGDGEPIVAREPSGCPASIERSAGSGRRRGRR